MQPNSVSNSKYPFVHSFLTASFPPKYNTGFSEYDYQCCTIRLVIAIETGMFAMSPDPLCLIQSWCAIERLSRKVLKVNATNNSYPKFGAVFGALIAAAMLLVAMSATGGQAPKAKQKAAPHKVKQTSAAHKAKQSASVHRAPQAASMHKARRTVSAHRAQRHTSAHNAIHTVPINPTGHVPRGAFLRRPVRSVAELIQQVRTDPIVARKFSRLFNMSPQMVRLALGNLHVDRTKTEMVRKVYYVHRGEVIGYIIRRVRKRHADLRLSGRHAHPARGLRQRAAGQPK